jgi:peptidoglycan/LPS O-acetylase OafA/YrhL
MKSSRLLPLEALRGLAAVIVVIHHFFLGFSPSTTGFLIETRSAESIIGHWYFFFFNGSAAVTFFFTLSGVVLCSKYLKTNDTKDLLITFLKRWPRLTFPVLITSLLSYFLFKLNFYFFQDASVITKSSWLATFANSGWTVNFNPDFFKVIYEALTTFFSGNSHYNSNLWTMKPEFIGSNFIFLLAIFFTFFNYRIFLLFLSALSFLAICVYPVIFSFASGFFLSTLVLRGQFSYLIKNINLSFVLIFIGIYFLGYSIPEKDYVWAVPFVAFKNLSIFIHTLGSIFLIYGILINRPIYGRLNGRISNFLGQISFSLYLIHILVISSLSSYFFIKLYQLGWNKQAVLALTFASLIFGSVFVSIPLMYLDKLWVNYINKFFTSVAKRLNFLFVP